MQVKWLYSMSSSNAIDRWLRAAQLSILYAVIVVD